MKTHISHPSHLQHHGRDSANTPLSHNWQGLNSTEVLVIFPSNSPQTILHESIVMMFYLHDATKGFNSATANAGNDTSNDEGILDEDCDNFASVTISELEDEDHQETSSPHLQLAPPAVGLPSVVEAADSTPIAPDPTDAERKPPHEKFIAHFDLQNNTIVFLSLDLETGGEYCGIIQLSGQLFWHDPTEPQGTTFLTVAETFNEYVRPPDGAFWNEEASSLSHGLCARSPEIQNG